jgi:DNA-3-methyladenine glycosylase
MKCSILPQSFFDRPVLDVAPELLGKFLVRERGGTIDELHITEVEAYDGPHDLACHASKGKTPRTAVMFGPAGHWYIYFVYGMHWMLNIVTGPEGYPAAVLIRGTSEVTGPARVTRHLSIGREQNEKPANRTSGLWIEDRGISIPRNAIKRTPRIGVDYAKEWAKKPYRFVWEK